MKLIRPLILAMLFFLSANLGAQDLHWTLFNYSPLTLNPGFTGAYEGTFRLGGIYRDQVPTGSFTSSLTSNVYKSPSFYIDSPIARGFRKQDWIGVGGTFYSDKAGDADLALNYALGSVAYHFGLDKKAQSTFTIGVQAGMGSRKIDPQKLLFAEDLMINLGTAPGQGNSKDFGRLGDASFFDLNFGLLLRSKVNKTTGFNVGLNARHLIPAKYQLIGANLNDKLPISFVLHSQLDVQMNKKWSLTPALQIQTSAPSTEIQLHGMMGYKFDPEKNVVLNFGLGYRLADAAQFLVGMDYDAFRVAASFDLGLSSQVAANQSFGGFELAVSYIGRIYKDPNIKPVIFCPRF